MWTTNSIRNKDSKKGKDNGRIWNDNQERGGRAEEAKEIKHRPEAITKLVGFLLMFVVLLAFAGIMLLLNLPQLEQNLQLEKTYYFLSIYYYYPLIGSVSDVPVYSESLIAREVSISFSKVMVGFCFFLAGLNLPASLGLLRMQKWGRYFGLILGIPYVFIGVFPILFIFDLTVIVGLFVLLAPFLILMGAEIFALLTGDMKYEFEQVDVENLIKDLKEGKKSIRLRAADALGVKGDSRAVDPLIEALRDEDKSVKEKAKKSLEKIGKAGLKSDDVDSRINAISIIGLIGGRRAVESLIPVLWDRDWEVREEAARTLGRIGNSSGEKLLLRLLKKEENEKVQKAARIALRKIERKQRLINK